MRRKGPYKDCRATNDDDDDDYHESLYEAGVHPTLEVSLSTLLLLPDIGY